MTFTLTYVWLYACALGDLPFHAPMWKGFKRQITSRHRREQESVTTEMAINKSETTDKGGAGIEVGCKEACRVSRKRKQLKAA